MKKIKLNKKYLGIINNSRFPFETVPDGNNTARWMILLSSAIEQYKRIPYNGPNKYKQGNDDDFYIALITPFIKVATIELLSLSGVFYGALDDKCKLDLENQLAKKLVYICSYTISISYKEKQDSSQFSGMDIEGYIKQIYANPLRLFKEYNVLARLLAMHTNYWIQATSILFKRLIADYAQLDQVFFDRHSNITGEEVIKTISELQLDLSDPHEYGQTVVIVSFDHKNKIVYKPKNMLAEHAFKKFVDWFNEQDNKAELKLSSVPVINKLTYGWSKFISNKPCESEKDIEQFYQRIGMFGAILYIIRGSDYHHDNLIAHANAPFFIDHEMLFYPLYVDRNNAEFKDQSIYDIQNNYYESVIGTRLFPIIEERRTGKTGDISAVGFFDPENENMALPFINEKYQRVHKYRDFVIDGFEYAYKLIQEKKENLLSDDSPLNEFKELDVRFNMRRTGSYLHIIHSAVVPAALKNGAVYVDYIYQLCNKFPSVFSKGLPQDIAKKELAILARLDVPRFTVKSTARGLNKEDKTKFDDIFELSGYELVLHRVKTMDNSKLKEQKKYLLQSLNEIGKAD
ncbi:MAG: DUF4135 domain-containing protein [Gammaproteobacteria bacterium]|nr:DUF4135 domain-containing protein [Gammaproteobacteria bacterium]